MSFPFPATVDGAKVLSHAQEQGNEFYLKLAESTWSKVLSVWLHKDLP